MIRGAKAAASQPAAAAAAEAVLGAGSGAVDAVIAGFFGAAGVHPGVILAPAIAIVGGFGAGGRAFDGRPAQPGSGAARPRGFVGDATIPPGARIAAPRTLGMLALLHTYRGRSSFLELARAGMAAAESAGSKPRAAFLRRVGSAGVLALRAPEVMRALVAVGGPVAGGALTEADLEGAAPVEADATAASLGDGVTAFTSPFGAPEEPRDDAEVIVACDGRGGIAALAYIPARDGVPVPDLGITLGRDAVPVMRGVPRVSPGTVLPAAAPVGIVVKSGGFSVAVGLPGQRALDGTALGELVTGASAETALAGLRERLGGRGAVAVVTDGKSARALSA